MPQDIPPQTVIINNTGQSGGQNIGIQNNFAPKPRKLSSDKLAALVKLLSPATKADPNIVISFGLSDPDTGDLGNQLVEAVKQAGLKARVVTGGTYMTNPPIFNVEIAIGDLSRPPDGMQIIVDAFRSVGLKTSVIAINGARTDLVQIGVGPQKKD